MSVRQSDIVVVGAGIIGCSIAVELAERGARVTVLEKAQVGMGCSYGNAGWMTPCFAMPLPMPGMMLKSIKWLMNPSSPLYIKPSISPELIYWLYRFMLAMNEKQALRSIEGLVQLSQISLEKYKKLFMEFPEIDFHQQGLLMVGQSQDGVHAAVDEMNLVSRFGVPGKYLNAEEVKSFEPSLVGKVSGGVYFPQEAHAEPLKVVKALEKKAIQLGVRFIENTEVLSFELNSRRITQINTSAGKMKSDQFVLASGSWSHDLARQLGLRVPVLGGKGYALIVDPLPNNPSRPLMLVEKKIAITPRQGSLRIAGTLELVNQDFSITQRRVDAIVRGAREFLELPSDFKIHELWKGLRPCTPDGVPLIGYHSKISNLMLSCGHQMLGLQAGYGTGEIVADMMEGRSSSLNTQIFSPDRF